MDKHSQFEYRVNAEQGANRVTLIQTNKVDTALECVTPPEFPNGIEGLWSPETYFLASIAGCFVNTFQALAKKFNFTSFGVGCEARGTVALVDGRFAFTEVTITPKIRIDSDSEEATAAKIAEKAHKYCLISNSVKCPVLMEEKIQVFVARNSLELV